jgi:DNA-directed RNA polymerase subunit RPC12/RpoP
MVMKFLCGRCKRRMESQGSEEGELSMSITFACPKCENMIFLVTNPGETKLVHSLGLSIGGKLLWTEDAKKRLEKIPRFVRPMAKKAVEKYARERKCSEITPGVMDEAKREMGM